MLTILTTLKLFLTSYDAYHLHVMTQPGNTTVVTKVLISLTANFVQAFLICHAYRLELYKKEGYVCYASFASNNLSVTDYYSHNKDNKEDCDSVDELLASLMRGRTHHQILLKIMDCEHNDRGAQRVLDSWRGGMKSKLGPVQSVTEGWGRSFLAKKKTHSFRTYLSTVKPRHNRFLADNSSG